MRPADAFDLVVTPRGLRFMGRHYPCVLGRGGITDHKREGDGATPSGAHEIVGVLYRPDRLAPPGLQAMAIGPGDFWCDDPDHADYNHLVRAPFAAPHEVLRRADPLYDLVLLTDWKWPNAISGKGSAIFIHRWRRPGGRSGGVEPCGAGPAAPPIERPPGLREQGDGGGHHPGRADPTAITCTGEQG